VIVITGSAPAQMKIISHCGAPAGSVSMVTDCCGLHRQRWSRHRTGHRDVRQQRFRLYLSKSSSWCALPQFSPVRLADHWHHQQALTTKLYNSGGKPLAISAITTAGPYTPNLTCGASLAVGSSCTVSVTFKPTNTGKPYVRHRSFLLTALSRAVHSPSIQAALS